MNASTTPLGRLDLLARDASAAFADARTDAEVEAARIEFLGLKQGQLKQAKDLLKAIPAEDKRTFGQRFNQVKEEVERAWADAKSRVGEAAVVEDFVDLTRPGVRHAIGHRHPLTQTTEELIDLFGRFGFQVARGPEVEDVRHNFESLNIPDSHPAREPADNFFIDAQTLLRSQTSTVQIRIMEQQPPPIRIVAIGRVYRPDETDETHSPMFHQIEGLMVDEGVTMADLKSILRLFARSYLGEDVKIRFRPSFFPFTEPSVEVDMAWHGGDRWVEMGGAGMVDPNVFRAVGYDPDRVSGFAFGLGIERLCMRRFGIRDIRSLYQNDVRFLKQF